MDKQVPTQLTYKGIRLDVAIAPYGNDGRTCHMIINLSSPNGMPFPHI